MLPTSEKSGGALLHRMSSIPHGPERANLTTRLLARLVSRATALKRWYGVEAASCNYSGSVTDQGIPR